MYNVDSFFTTTFSNSGSRSVLFLKKNIVMFMWVYPEFISEKLMGGNFVARGTVIIAKYTTFLAEKTLVVYVEIRGVE